MNHEEMEIDLRELWEIIAKRKILIVTITLLAMIISGCVSVFLLEPVYEAKASIVIQKEGAAYFEDRNYTNSDVMMQQKLIKTYVEILKSSRVMDRVTEALSHKDINYGTKTLDEMVKGVAKSDSLMFTISVKSKIPAETETIANTFAEIFIEEGEYYLPAAKLKTLDEASIPKKPVSPNIKLNIIIAAFLGMMISCGIAFLIEFLDVKVKGEEDMKKLLGIPVLVVIPISE